MTLARLNCGAILLMFAALPVRASEDKDVIDYRQHVMRALDEETAALGMVVSTQVPNDNLVSHLEAIATIASSALKTFEPKVLGGEAKPVVWEKWADFSSRMNDMAVKTAQLAETGRKNGQDAIMNDMVAALSCKSCHDIYRQKK